MVIFFSLLSFLERTGGGEFSDSRLINLKNNIGQRRKRRAVERLMMSRLIMQTEEGKR